MVKTGQFTTKVHAVYRSTIQSSYWCRHICPVLISTYDTHYLFIRPVFTARMYGCIWAVCMVLSFWHPFDTCTYGCRNMHPYVRSVQTGRTYGCIFRHPYSLYTWREMSANAQRDGRPVEYRWRPLFNAAKFGWRPILDCRAVTLPRRETRWNLLGCPKLTIRSQPLVGQSSPSERVEEVLLLNKYFSDCRYVP